MRLRRRFLLGLMFILLFGSTGSVAARAIINDEICTVGANTVIQGNAFVLCGELRVDGRITGNLIGAARTAQISGTVEGATYLIAGELDLSGRSGSSLHYGGLDLNIMEGASFGDKASLLVATLSTRIAENTEIGGSVIAASYQLLAHGDIGEEVNFWGSALTLGGRIGGDVDAVVGDTQDEDVSSQIETLLVPLNLFGFDIALIDPGLLVAETAAIDGRLSYRAPSPGIIEAELAQQPIFRSTASPDLIGTTTQETARGLRLYFNRVFREFATLALIGVIGLLSMPQQLRATLRPLQMHPVSTFGVGMLSFILSFPIVLLIFLVSVLIVLILNFLPLDDLVLVGAIVLGLANIGGAGLFYFTAIYISRVIVGLALGRLLLRLSRRDDGTLRSLFISLALGLFILSLFGPIPVMGILVYAAALFWGLGAILSVIRDQVQRFGETPAPAPPSGRYTAEFLSVPPVLPYFPDEPRAFPPPMDDDGQPTGHGTENLPEGFDFDWWNDNGEGAE